MDEKKEDPIRYEDTVDLRIVACTQCGQDICAHYLTMGICPDCQSAGGDPS